MCFEYLIGAKAAHFGYIRFFGGSNTKQMQINSQTYWLNYQEGSIPQI